MRINLTLRMSRALLRVGSMPLFDVAFITNGRPDPARSRLPHPHLVISSMKAARSDATLSGSSQ